jgi:selenocysteine lyase/cysteine desulfurase
MPMRTGLTPTKGYAAYLNYASTGLLPPETVRAVHWVTKYQAERGSLPKETYEPVLQEVRSLAASLIHADPQEMALTTNTTQGLQMAATAIPWRDGDELVITRYSFPANYYVWLPLRERIRLMVVDAPYGPGLEEALLKAVTRRTRAIAVDWVHFHTGYRVDLARLSEFCRRRRIHLVLDAMQGLGALSLNVRATPVSFLAVGGAKWLTAPWATGFAFVSRDIHDDLNPAGAGWLSYRWETFERLAGDVSLRPGAARFEGGTFNYPGFYGMRESLRRILATPESARAKAALGHTEWLRERLRDRDGRILSDFATSQSSAIVSFRPRLHSAARVFAGLQRARISCSFREGHIRVSPHFFTPQSHLEALIEAL